MFEDLRRHAAANEEILVPIVQWALPGMIVLFALVVALTAIDTLSYNRKNPWPYVAVVASVAAGIGAGWFMGRASEGSGVLMGCAIVLGWVAHLNRLPWRVEATARRAD
jgi:hypothetical protein